MDTVTLYPDEAEILGLMVIDGATYTIYEHETDPSFFWVDSQHAKKIGKIMSKNIYSDLMERIQANNGKVTIKVKEYDNWWDR